MIRVLAPLFETGRSKSRFLAAGGVILLLLLLLLVVVLYIAVLVGIVLNLIPPVSACTREEVVAIKANFNIFNE